jgi:hypothetical protein
MRRTKSGLPKYCGWNIDREDGKRRVRFRKGAFSVYIEGTPWGEPFMRAYAAALDGLKAQPANIGMERTKAGTINALIVSYYKLIFPTLKSSTQKMRRNILERFRRDFGDKPSPGSNMLTSPALSQPRRTRRKRRTTYARCSAIFSTMAWRCA